MMITFPFTIFDILPYIQDMINARKREKNWKTETEEETHGKIGKRKEREKQRKIREQKERENTEKIEKERKR